MVNIKPRGNNTIVFARRPRPMHACANLIFTYFHVSHDTKISWFATKRCETQWTRDERTINTCFMHLFSSRQSSSIYLSFQCTPDSGRQHRFHSTTFSELIVKWQKLMVKLIIRANNVVSHVHDINNHKIKLSRSFCRLTQHWQRTKKIANEFRIHKISTKCQKSACIYRFDCLKAFSFCVVCSTLSAKLCALSIFVSFCLYQRPSAWNLKNSRFHFII